MSALWVCVGIASRGGYLLVHPQTGDGEPFTSGERCANGDAAVPIQTSCHGMLVTRGKDELVLCGPLVLFVPEQGELSASSNRWAGNMSQSLNLPRNDLD